MSTLDAIQYSEYMTEPPRLLYCVWKASLKFASEEQAYFHCVAARVEENGSHEISGKSKLGAKRDVAFGLLLCCEHCICLGLLSVRVCVT